MIENEEQMPNFHISDSVIEALGGLAGVVLSILGLALVYPWTMAAIATIVIGASFLFAGGSIVPRVTRMFRAPPQRRTGAVSKGLTGEERREPVFEPLGGALGIVLGIVALLGIEPVLMLGLATIVFGASFLIAQETAARLNAFRIFHTGGAYVREMADVAIGIQALVGIAAIVLGILALVGINELNMILIGLLAVGTVHVVFGSALTAMAAVNEHMKLSEESERQEASRSRDASFDQHL